MAAHRLARLAAHTGGGTHAGAAAPAAAVALDGPYDAQLGPYPVGVTTMQLDDRRRPDAGTVSGGRALLTEVYYPAEDDARGLPKNRYSEFLLRGSAPGVVAAAESDTGLGWYRKGITVRGLDATWRNAAVRDARVRAGPAPWPLVVFSHGSGGLRFSYPYLLEMLASHGYVVVSADHTGNARFTVVDGKVVMMGGEKGKRSRDDRPHDVSFLIDEMARMARGADSRFAGRVACGRVGACGMSFGGYTAMAAAEIDPRIVCVMPLAAGGFPDAGRKNRSTPAMVMVGAEDAVVNNGVNRQYYDATDAASYWVELPLGGHMTFSSIDQYNPNFGNGLGRSNKRGGGTYDGVAPARAHAIINSHALAFFNLHLRGDQDWADWLRHSHYGDGDLRYESKTKAQPYRPRREAKAVAGERVG